MRKFQKIITCIVTVGLIIVFGIVNVNAEEIETKAVETTVNVHKSYPTTLYNNGCYSSTNIKLTGTYVV